METISLVALSQEYDISLQIKYTFRREKQS
jgi:hypothetical protein